MQSFGRREGQLKDTYVRLDLSGALGFVLPFGRRELFRRSLASEYLKTPILLSGAIGVYVVGEAIQPETGLVGATPFGVVLAEIEVTSLQELRRFEEALTVFLVSGLFILLTSDIDPKVLRSLDWPIATTALFMVFVARPLAIRLATLGTRMSWKERLLIGWIGPRGVVAAAVAGVAADKLVRLGYPGAANLLPHGVRTYCAHRRAARAEPCTLGVAARPGLGGAAGLSHRGRVAQDGRAGEGRPGAGQSCGDRRQEVRRPGGGPPCGNAYAGGGDLFRL